MEWKGMALAINALGEKIAQLESDLLYEKCCKENAESTAARLTEENEKLRSKLKEVENFVDKEANKWQFRS